MSDAQTIWLVGMMGAGKSSVGRALARRLGLGFVDSDEEVERGAGMSVAEIFAREGETGFRRRECQVVESLIGEAAVVALGGGALAQPGLGERVLASGTAVHLRARPERLLERVGLGGERPLLAARAPAERLERLRQLLEQRGPQYARAALQIDTDELSVAEVAEQLARSLAGSRASAEGS